MTKNYYNIKYSEPCIKENNSKLNSTINDKRSNKKTAAKRLYKENNINKLEFSQA